MLPDNACQGRRARVIDHDRVHLSATLEQSEHRHFASCATAPLALARAAKIALISFDFAEETTVPSTRARPRSLRTTCGRTVSLWGD